MAIIRPAPSPEILRAAREMHAKGYGHDCYEWVDAGVCQVCGREIERTAMEGMPRDVLIQIIHSELDEAVRLAAEISHKQAAQEGSINRALLIMRALRQQDIKAAEEDIADRQRGKIISDAAFLFPDEDK